jgi:carboxylesterase
MGGLVTLELARRHPRRVKAVGLLATALRLPETAERIDVALAGLWPLLPGRLRDRLALPKIAGSDIADPTLRRLNGLAQGRAAMPLCALRSLFELGAYLRPRLGEVKQPALVAHGARDRTVPPGASEELARGLPNVVEKHLFLASRHVLTLDVDRGPLFRLLTDFLRRTVGEPRKE